MCSNPRLSDEDDDCYNEDDDDVDDGDVVGDEDESQTGVDSEQNELRTGAKQSKYGDKCCDNVNETNDGG